MLVDQFGPLVVAVDYSGPTGARARAPRLCFASCASAGLDALWLVKVRAAADAILHFIQI